MKMNRFILLLVLLLYPLLRLWCLEEGGQQQVRIAGISYMIGEEDSRRAGLTREQALRRYYRLNVGDIFDTPDDLEKKLAKVTRDLMAQQIFEDITYEVNYWREDFPLLPADNLGAHITITVKDSITFYLFPTVVYDSNLGMIYGGNLTYNNVLGTLTDFNFKGYGGKETWRVGGTWEKVPINRFKSDISLFCEEERTRRVDDDDKTVLEYTNLLLDFYFKFDVPISYDWEASVRPGVYYPFNYQLVDYDSDYGRDEFDDLSPETSAFTEFIFTYSSIYWEENFRRGVQSEVIFALEGAINAEWDPVFSLDGSVSGFYRPLSFLGMGHNISAFYVFDDIREDAGEHLRGVLDYLMYGEWGAFLNNNVDIRAFSIPPVVELHAYPFLDLGVVYNESTPYEAYDFRLTSGVGITLFPLFLQSLQLNVEVGYDLLNEGDPEITIKSELFF